MLDIRQRLIGLVAGGVIAQSAAAFSLLGPFETWQTPTLGYGNHTVFGNSFPGDVAGPKGFNEGSRLNVPLITYAFDYTFTEYFGQQGVKDVDAAMAVLNGLPPASSINPDDYLTDDDQVINYTAQALNLRDLKSNIMGLMLEHMGLSGELHVWDLRFRVPVPNGAPCDFYYITYNDNFDPVTYSPSAYVNGVLYGYDITDLCRTSDQEAEAVEYPKDRNANAPFFTSVASKEGYIIGAYYLGLTRDDVGGIKYLYRKSRLVNETLDLASTNITPVIATNGANGVTIISTGGSSPWGIYGPTTNIVITNSNTNINLILTNISTLFGGVEKIQFVKVAYNSFLTGTFAPLTYTYNVPVVINNQFVTLTMARTIVAPDIIFSAADLNNAGVTPPRVDAWGRSIGFNASPLAPAAAQAPNGPGVVPSTIQPQAIITLNSAIPVYWNMPALQLSDSSLLTRQQFVWGSFDGSGNPPYVYPQGSSVEGLEQAVLAGSTTPPPVSTTTTSGSTPITSSSPPWSIFAGSTNGATVLVGVGGTGTTTGGQ